MYYRLVINFIRWLLKVPLTKKKELHLANIWSNPFQYAIYLSIYRPRDTEKEQEEKEMEEPFNSCYYNNKKKILPPNFSL
ncbi:hypothetical protein L6452_18491 [Arctium lappa]|uniref:Uncharacterized protein n=1 Tax=Arctium lappa TaxID=4217 RepID=A0ACB9C6C8_ARCLA|nr:hypothetical protein L6452_18491 [Arctium lappa]